MNEAGRPHLEARTLLLASRYVLPVTIVAVLFFLYLPLEMQEFDVERTKDHFRATTELMASIVAPGLDFDEAEHVQGQLAGMAASTGAQLLEVRRDDDTVMASWRSPKVTRDPPPVRTPGVAVHDGVLHAVVHIQAQGGARGTMIASFGLGEILERRAEHVFPIRFAATALLVLGLALGWGAAAIAVRRERAEDALQRSVEGFFGFVNTLPDAVLVHREGRIEHANPAAVAMLGCGVERDLVGKPYLDLVHPKDRDAARLELERVTSDEPAQAPVELRFSSIGDAVAVASVASVRLPYEDGRAVASVARDLTESKRVQMQLAFADRMMSVGTMASGIAHEINNPLTFVIGNLDLLRKEIGGKEDQLAALGLEDAGGIIEDACEGAQRVRRIVSDLKTFSGSGKEDVWRLDVRDPLNAAIKMAFNEVRHRAQLRLDLPEVPPVAGSEPGLCQVFLNLIINASHAIPEGRASENEIAISVRAEGDDLVEVEISDTGTGIAPEHLPRLFDPFFTTKPVGEGTGLGLSICHSIVRQHGGEIAVDSQLGKGTSFKVVLPVARGEVDARPRFTTTTGRTHGATVLVIDDEEAVGRLFERVLSPRHRVIVCTSPAEALALLDAGESPDVVFCDLMMPDITGMQVFERVIRDLPEMADRFVFTTGGAFTRHGRKFVDHTTRPVLRKPFTPAIISQTVDRMVQARRSGRGVGAGPGGTPPRTRGSTTG